MSEGPFDVEVKNEGEDTIVLIDGHEFVLEEGELLKIGGLYERNK